MEQLIPLVNKLQDAFSAVGLHLIDLPQIITVGSQSSGKSSVLESIVGRDFLPRGTGIVTRRPLVLQLYNIPRTKLVDGQESASEEYGEFYHLPNRKFTDFSEIRTEIIRETDRETGKNKGISSKTINLRIYSPHVLNLTLVDLPGITRVPTGDQPEDVEEQIRRMCLSFIENPNAIILAVSAANQDLANSDGIKLARSVDADGERTIGVLTKVDIMDHGTDCCDVLSNKVIPLRRGYIAVVNRSQRDIDGNATVRNGLTKELEYFQGHSKYRNLLPKCGTTNLALTLNKMLVQHIRNCLPEIKAKISTSLNAYQKLLNDLGETMGDSGYKQLFLRIISDYSNNVSSATEGNSGSDNKLKAELVGGGRIKYIFDETFGATLQQVSRIEGLDDNTIRIAIANAYGSSTALFIPDKAYYELVRKQIEFLEEPGLQCAELVFTEMVDITESAIPNEMKRFPVLKDRVLDVARSLLSKCLKPTKDFISDTIKVEKSFINNRHPDFIGAKQAVSQAQDKLKQLKQAQQNSMNSNGNDVDSASKANDLGNNSAHSDETNIRKLSPALVTHVVGNSSSSGHGASSQQQRGDDQTGQGQGRGFLDLFQRKPGNANVPTRSGAVPGEMAGGGGGHSSATSAQSRAAVSVNGYRGNNNSNAASSYKSNIDPSPDFNFGNFEEAKELRLPGIPDHIRFMPPPTDKEKTELEIIKILIDSYFNSVVKKSFVDKIPKIVSCFLLDTFKRDLHNELVNCLFNENLSKDLMRESDDISEKRRNCETMKDILTRAMSVLNEAREFVFNDK